MVVWIITVHSEWWILKRWLRVLRSLFGGGGAAVLMAAAAVIAPCSAIESRLSIRSSSFRMSSLIAVSSPVRRCSMSSYRLFCCAVVGPVKAETPDSGLLEAVDAVCGFLATVCAQVMPLIIPLPGGSW